MKTMQWLDMIISAIICKSGRNEFPGIFCSKDMFSVLSGNLKIYIQGLLFQDC